MTLTFTDPRPRATFDDWPSGRHRVKCEFYPEHDAKRGFRMCRRTQDKDGRWCKPKATTFSGPCIVATGSDGKTYVLQVAARYRFISIHTHDFMSATPSGVFQQDDGYQELYDTIIKAQDPNVFAYANR